MITAKRSKRPAVKTPFIDVQFDSTDHFPDLLGKKQRCKYVSCLQRIHNSKL
jgi:hypothetical protein